MLKKDWFMGFCSLKKEKLIVPEGFNDFLYKNVDLVDNDQLGQGISRLLNIYKDYCIHEL